MIKKPTDEVRRAIISLGDNSNWRRIVGWFELICREETKSALYSDRTEDKGRGQILIELIEGIKKAPEDYAKNEALRIKQAQKL